MRRLLLRLLLTSGVVVVVATQARLAAADVEVRETDVASYPSVKVTVSTDDPTPVDPSDVRVIENGVAVAVEDVRLLAGETGTVDTVLAIDISNSMRGRELATALAAAEAFVHQAALPIDIGVLAFAEEPIIVAPVSGERGSIIESVSAMSAATSHGTALFEAVVAASGMFEGEGQHNLVLLTDGRNTVEDTGLDEAIAAAASAGVNVFAFGLEGGEPDVGTLSRLASSTGGAFRLLSPDDLGAAYRSLALELGRQYVVTYRSKTPPGTAATVIISMPGGSAEVGVLMPAPAVEAGARNTVLLGSLLEGDVGAAILVLLTFLAVVSLMSLVATFVAGHRRRRELEARMAAAPQAGRSSDTEASGWVPRPVAEVAEWGAEATHTAGRLARMIERAGWKIHMGDFLVPALLGPVLITATLWLLGGPVWAILGGIVAFAFPFQLLARAGRKRIDVLQAQLPDVLMILASSLRAGHSFLQALDSVAKEVDDPAATEFARALAEIQLGRNVDDALEALSKRVDSKDLDWAVTAISIQRRVGGNLSEILETVANTIREREQMRRQIKVLSADGRISMYILIGLPFLILGYLVMVTPSYLEPLTSTAIGIMLLGGAALLMLVGYIVMRRIVRLDV